MVHAEHEGEGLLAETTAIPDSEQVAAQGSLQIALHGEIDNAELLLECVQTFKASSARARTAHRRPTARKFVVAQQVAVEVIGLPLRAPGTWSIAAKGGLASRLPRRLLSVERNGY